jgi:hypothetical protein
LIAVARQPVMTHEEQEVPYRVIRLGMCTPRSGNRALCGMSWPTDSTIGASRS